MGERRFAYRVVVRRPEGKRPLGRLGRKWEEKQLMFKKWNGELGSWLIWLGIGTGGGIL